MRQMQFPGSDLVIEEALPSGENYERYIASYRSQNNKIYGLLTIPDGTIPKNGFPAVVFAHGFVPPSEYKTGAEYQQEIDMLAQHDYVVFQPDFRGHGNSEGDARGTYFSAGYTIDFLNALASLKKHKDVNIDKIGVWGHSMGGNIVLRSLTVSHDIQAAEIWSGVVGSYKDLLYHWDHSAAWESSEVYQHMIKPSEMIQDYGSLQDNPSFWNSISPLSYISSITIPVQIQAGQKDEVVPWEFSQELYTQLQKQHKNSEILLYPDAGHEFIDTDLGAALQQTLEFFDKYLK
jgi:dipeptidyl aminopeptidase/acylaminoacyl peptidase